MKLEFMIGIYNTELRREATKHDYSPDMASNFFFELYDNCLCHETPEEAVIDSYLTVHYTIHNKNNRRIIHG